MTRAAARLRGHPHCPTHAVSCHCMLGGARPTRAWKHQPAPSAQHIAKPYSAATCRISPAILCCCGPCHSMQMHAVRCQLALHHATSVRRIKCPTLPCCSAQRSAVLYCAMPCRLLLCGVGPFQYYKLKNRTSNF